MLSTCVISIGLCCGSSTMMMGWDSFLPDPDIGGELSSSSPSSAQGAKLCVMRNALNADTRSSTTSGELNPANGIPCLSL